jgi:Rieske 2Fe-2S family protein
MPNHVHTLTRNDYLSDHVWIAERALMFHGGWFMVGAAARLQRGNRTVVDVAGESVLLTRDLDGRLHAFANVCRHRGARLCDSHTDSGQGSLMCPYHAWTYALDGRLIATPHLDETEVDKGTLPLWQYHLREWQGIAFVSLSHDPPDFDGWMQTHCKELLALERFSFGELQVVHTSTCDIAANWKIVVENYQECLHCTRVHPELVDLVPIYRTGWVYDHDRPDGGVSLSRGSTMSESPLDMPALPGSVGTDGTSYFGATIFPNGFMDVTGPSAVLSTLYPKGPNLTTMTMEFLFDPAVVATPGFDPAPIVQFNELVAEQDNLVCERVHQGVGSVSFDHGVLSPKDDLVIAFVEHYRATMAGS